METAIFYDKLIKLHDGKLYIDGEFVCDGVESIDSAKQIAECFRLSQELAQDLKPESKEISDADITVAIHENETFRVTEQTVNMFREAIKQKMFLPSNALLELREGSSIYPGKIEYVLNDGSVALLDIDTNRQLNSLIDITEHSSLLKDMLRDSTSFIAIVEQLLEDQ